MNRTQSTPPDNVAPPALHPVLQAALASLDVELDAELSRYRRSRYGKAAVTTPAVTVARPAAKSRSLDLINIKSHAPTPPAPAAASPGQTSPVDQASMSAPAEAGVDLASAPATSAATQAIPPLFSASPELRPVVNAKTALLVQQHMNSQAGQAIAPLAADPATDYLESSAHLLNELAQAEATADDDATRATSGFAQQLFTPLGMGSMLLLLCSSIALGYAISNPGAVSHLERLMGRSPEAEVDPTAAARTGLSSDPLSDSSNPDLATEEFVDLDLGTLSTLPGTDTPPSLATSEADAENGTDPLAADPTDPAPVPAGTSGVFDSVPTGESGAAVSSSASTLRSEVPRPAPLPQQSAAAPPASPPARSTAPAAASSPAPASSSNRVAAAPTEPAATANDVAADLAAHSSEYYYVVTNYEGDPSLETARTVVNDAYVRNFDEGAQIQLGAFDDAASAEELVQRLEAEGITAEVKAP